MKRFDCSGSSDGGLAQHISMNVAGIRFTSFAREFAKYAFVFLCVGPVLGVVATEAFWRYLPACGD
jgi:hypothetical protein